jgi:hypothetical protein
VQAVPRVVHTWPALTWPIGRLVGGGGMFCLYARSLRCLSCPAPLSPNFRVVFGPCSPAGVAAVASVLPTWQIFSQINQIIRTLEKIQKFFPLHNIFVEAIFIVFIFKYARCNTFENQLIVKSFCRNSSWFVKTKLQNIYMSASFSGPTDGFFDPCCVLWPKFRPLGNTGWCPPQQPSVDSTFSRQPAGGAMVGCSHLRAYCGTCLCVCASARSGCALRAGIKIAIFFLGGGGRVEVTIDVLFVNASASPLPLVWSSL